MLFLTVTLLNLMVLSKLGKHSANIIGIRCGEQIVTNHHLKVNNVHIFN